MPTAPMARVALDPLSLQTPVFQVNRTAGSEPEPKLADILGQSVEQETTAPMVGPPAAATRRAETGMIVDHRRAQLERMLVKPELFPGGMGLGTTRDPESPMAPFGAEARRQAASALATRPPLDPNNAYVRHQATLRDQLDRLDLRPEGNARIHIDEHVEDHGKRVLRAAAGETSLVKGADLTMKTGAPANALARDVLSPEQLARIEKIPAREDQIHRGDVTGDELVDISADQLERQLLDKRVRIAGINRAVPDDGKLTLVNTSWGSNLSASAGQMGSSMIAAPPDSKLGQEAKEILGHAPRREPTADGYGEYNEQDLNKLSTVMGERLERRMQEPDVKARFDKARDDFGAELAKGREKGVLVFSNAGNELKDATDLGHPEWSAPIDGGTKNLIVVGAVETPQPGRADKVAPFSAEGAITVSAPGVDIPLAEGEGTERSGTSYATPITLQTAFLMNAVNPKLTADQIAERLVDPRSVRDVPGTTRDGAGRVDPFAAVLISANPSLTSDQIERARAKLESPATDMGSVRRELGLP